MLVCDILYLTRMQRSFFGSKVSAFIMVPPLVHRYGQCGHANQNERESGKVCIKRAMRTVHSFFVLFCVATGRNIRREMLAIKIYSFIFAEAGGGDAACFRFVLS